MVALDVVRASNKKIATALPARLVGVFVGATSGIGEYSLKSFARHVKEPRAYFIGRNQDAGARIVDECKVLNPAGEYTFLAADTSLIRNVDSVCADIKKQEDVVHMLVLSQGTLLTGIETEEGLHLAAALVHYARTRFILNLMPLLERAEVLRRVVTIFVGGLEGRVDTDDIQLRSNVKLMAQRGHGASLVTLSMVKIAEAHPTVSFVHDFPSFVRSNISRGTTGWAMGLLKGVTGVLGRFLYIPNDESGDRHLYLATSARYPAVEHDKASVGVPADAVARGIDGSKGSGMYSVNQYGESARESVEQVVKDQQKDGTADTVWKDLEGHFKRITGKMADWNEDMGGPL